MKYPSRVSIVEVGARDGLQNEKQEVTAAVKIELVNRLSAAGFRNVEAGSFVSPKWVPQMATSADVMAGIERKPGVIYSVLTPNLKGFEGALAARADEVVIFGAASEAFSQKNINCSIAESIERFRPVAEAAKANGMRVRAAVSCALGCPYQGEVPIESVVDCVKRFADLGCDDIGIADTIGVGTPARTSAVFRRRPGPIRWRRSPGISTTPTARPAPTCLPASSWACLRSTPRSPASAAARTPRARPAMSRPRTCCTCCTAWASKPASTSISSARPASSSRKRWAGRRTRA